MGYEQISVEAEATNQIRSHIRTLNSYLSRSLRSHNRVVESVHVYARSIEPTINSLIEDWGHDPQVQRWGLKYHNICDQYDLLEPRVGD